MLTYCLNQCSHLLFFFFFFNDTATTEIYTLSLHDALPISDGPSLEEQASAMMRSGASPNQRCVWRSEEHTSELQSPCNLVCRLLLEKKKQQNSHNDVTQSGSIALQHRSACATACGCAS